MTDLVQLLTDNAGVRRGSLMQGSDRVFVPKGWGWEDWIVNSELYCGKRLFVKQHKRCSWHYHPIKDEVLYIDAGRLRLLYSLGDVIDYAEECVLGPGDAFHVPPGLRHRFFGDLDTYITEISTHHDDKDVVRLLKGD